MVDDIGPSGLLKTKLMLHWCYCLQSNYMKREHTELINDLIIGFLISLY